MVSEIPPGYKAGTFSLSIFLGPQRSYQLTVVLVVAFVACSTAQIPGAYIITGLAGVLMVFETYLLDMAKPAKCGR